ncbi:hypothetical protein [Marinactinospora rubrisoli]|uniref:DUF5668 domain-containing protein n=1 Tax=Marinactinospora rubrisoli TaxID=2715399 RepID=A0ABW2KJF5_9ACTN
MSRRRTDWGSLIAGLLFILLGVGFVVQGTTGWRFDAMWVLPVLAVGLGLVGVARALTRARDRRQP